MKTNRKYKSAYIIFLVLLIFNSQKIMSQSSCYNDIDDIEITNLSENSIFVHPNYPNIVINANNWSLGETGSVDVYISSNWGTNWTFAYRADGWYDPSVVIDLDGRFYVTHISNQYGGPVLISYSDDGSNWTDGTITEMGSDQPFLWVDNNCNSSFKNRLYCSWGSERTEVHRYPEGIHVSYSTDQGETWSSPEQISQGSPWLSGSVLKTDAEGNVYATWRISIENNPSIWNKLDFSKSTDGGITWNNNSNQFPYQIDGFSGLFEAGGGQSAFSINQQTDELFLMWSSRTELSSIYQIYFIKSTDGGINWSSSPILIEQDNSVDNTFPSLACDPETGILTCIYYSEDNNNYDTYIAISTNSGTNWCNLKINYETGSGFAGGDYISIAMSKGIVYPVWSTLLNNFTHTFTSPIDIINRNFVHTPKISGSKFIASNSISTSGDYSDFSQSNLSFEAGYYIDLLNGFEINAGNNFRASIIYCSADENESNTFANKFVQNKVNKTSYSKNEQMPTEFKLHQNYPNPFNSSTLIKYDLKENAKVKITIYDILGTEVKILVNEFLSAGYQSVIWDGTNRNGVMVSSGLYFYKIRAGDFIETKKLIIIK